ncbi:MAG: (Fe-S)-binding protein [Deltaproteobacteria bacterium]|nr:(Fe-S)-binding protein [Deltaproteobacteria bacterium]
MNDFEDLCPNCGACKDVCPFLAEYGTPDRILRKRPEVSFYCTSCRRCDGVCPRGLSPSAAFFAVKRRLVRQDRIPSPVRKTLDGARRFAKAGHGFPFSCYQSADTVFWPGCGLAANRPGLVRRTRKILSRRLHQQVGLVLDCCYDPVYGLGDTETAFAALRKIGGRLRDHGVSQVITGCLNCHKLLSEHLEDIQVVFILEVLPPEIFEKQSMDSVYLHHPCPSSRWEAIRDKAEKLVGHIHPSPGTDFKFIPISEASAAHCCGNGGGLTALDPALADRFLDRITGEAAGRTIVTYCTGCQNRFLKRGVEAVHLLECLPGVKPHRKIPSTPRQWVNRFALAMVERLNHLHCFRKRGIDCVATGNDQKSPEGKLKYIDKCGLSGK